MITVKNLCKSYGSILAVNDVSLEVKKGEVLGFLGPNGAGKTTTMRMITGFLPPTSGTAEVCGYDVSQEPVKVKQNIGYLPESAPSYGSMTVVDFLRFIAELRGMRGAEKTSKVSAAIEQCRLEKVVNQSIATLSKGYRQRACFAQAIIHNPPVLIMDEPTDGLDPNQKHVVRLMIKDMAAEKVIVVSTHILEEVEAVCSRVVIIANGSIVANSTPDELKSRSKNGRLDDIFRELTIGKGEHNNG